MSCKISTAATLLALAACARPAATAPAGPASGSTGTVAFSRAIVLRTSGAPAHDTAVTFRAGQARTILMLHAPPDDLVFAELSFPPSAFAADSGRDVTIRLRPQPGVYGLDIESSSTIGKGATLTFKYPRYFSAPPEARRVFGTDAAYERALAIGRLQPDSVLAFLPSTRPVADNLRATLPSSGTYFVAAR